MSGRGFTVIELLVAAALALVASAALAGLSYGMQRAFDRSIASVDLTARARTGLRALVSDLRSAGSGIVIGAALHALPDVAAVVLPHRSLDDDSVVSPFAAITLLRATGAQGILRDAVVAGTVVLQLDAESPSARQDGTAGLQVGDSAFVFDVSRVEPVVIAAVNPASWTVTLRTPIQHAFAPGAVIAGIQRTTYGVRRDASGTTKLVRRSWWGAEQPVVDHVSEFELELWGVAEPPRPGAHVDWFPSYGPVAPALGTDDTRDAWPPGENCTLGIDAAGLRVARLPPIGPAGTLVRLTASMLSDGPWCPDSAGPLAFDADLLRLTRVDLRLRFEDAAGNAPSTTPPVSTFVSIALRQR